MSRRLLLLSVMRECSPRFMPIWLRRTSSQITISSMRAMSRVPISSRRNLAMAWAWLALPGSTHWYQAETGYDLTHFSIDWEAETVTCPEGRISSSWTPVQDAGKSLIKVKFSQSDCKVCPKRASCTGTTRRTLTLHRRRADAGAFCGAKAEKARRLSRTPIAIGQALKALILRQCAPWAYAARGISVCTKPIWAMWLLPPQSLSFN
jgi:Transposase DDE domain